jgi:hypothetical protein
MEIDPRFKAAKQRAAQRRRNAWAVPVVLGGAGVLAILGVVLALYFGGVVTIGTPDAPVDVAEEEVPSSYALAFVDLAGDPMLLHFDKSAAAAKTRKLLRPLDIPADRAGDELSLLSDDLISGQESLITTLPSSREDFAYFQAQRAAPVAPPVQVPSETPAAVVVADSEGSWGENLDGSSAPVTYVKTQIENTTSPKPRARRPIKILS